MKIYYQWNPWSYMHQASLGIYEKLVWVKIDPDFDIIWLSSFNEVWEKIKDWNIWVLAIENSYMWSIHTNLYNFLKYDAKIIWEYDLDINHCICSKEKHTKDIKKVYSQLPALEQCKNYIKNNNFEWVEYSDTALSAKYVKENNDSWLWAICSEQAAKIYDLNILEKNIQDQNWNTTRFLIIVNKDLDLSYKNKSNKVSLLFETKDIPASLYKCLWAFATNDINLTKIESMPSYDKRFKYIFWLDFEWNLDDKKTQNAMEELSLFSKNIRILWDY